MTKISKADYAFMFSIIATGYTMKATMYEHEVLKATEDRLGVILKKLGLEVESEPEPNNEEQKKVKKTTKKVNKAVNEATEAP